MRNVVVLRYHENEQRHGGQGEELVHERVGVRSELGDNVELPRKIPVEQIGHCRYNQGTKGEPEYPCVIDPRIDQSGSEENKHQRKPNKRQESNKAKPGRLPIGKAFAFFVLFRHSYSPSWYRTNLLMLRLSSISLR